ncbi:MAG: hypothetical protein SGI98_03830 [Verrucomicrobiota bacterium]|nr:hypothetical protein [Verrucomicrobiota bacterium]
MIEYHVPTTNNETPLDPTEEGYHTSSAAPEGSDRLAEMFKKVREEMMISQTKLQQSHNTLIFNILCTTAIAGLVIFVYFKKFR